MKFASFFSSQPPGDAIGVEAFRDVASARQKWLQLSQMNPETRGMLFAGSSRPGVQDVESVILPWNGLLLISESCRWLLPLDWSTFDRAVEGVSASSQFPEMGLYIGRNGWGYSEDQAAEAQRRVQMPPEASAASHTDSHIVARDHAGFLAALSAMGEDDPFLIARHLPDWALGVPFDQLPLTVRCRNVLQKQRVVRLADLGKFTREEAMDWQNFGRSSVKDLGTALVSFLREGPAQLSSREELPDVLELPPLLQCLRQSTTVMSEREAFVWKARMGLDGPSMTLEQLAKLHGVTRERIRQIEAKTLRNYRQLNPWVDAIGPRVNVALHNRDTALFVEDLEQQDSWFAGIAEQPEVLGTLFEYFGPAQLHVWRSDGKALITTIERSEWFILKRSILATLRSLTDHDFSQGDVELTVKSALGGTASALTSLMLAELRPYLRFADGEGDNCRLLSVGMGLTAEIRAIIQNSREPLHYSEVAAQCEASLGRAVNQQQVNNTLAAFEDTFLISVVEHTGSVVTSRYPSRSGYGILNLADEIVLTDPNLRQWHTDEILAEIGHIKPELAAILDKYLLNAILSASEQIVVMGRMVRIAKKFQGDIPRQRIEIQDACVRLLRDAGRPLDNRELKEQLSSIRGMSPFFALSPNAEMARILPGVWGLISRDFASTSTERQTVLDQLYSALVERQAPIHMRDLRTIVYENQILPSGMTPYMVMNLAQSDSRMHVYRGRYIGLEGWESLIAEMYDEDVESPHMTLDFGDSDATDITVR